MVGFYCCLQEMTTPPPAYPEPVAEPIEVSYMYWLSIPMLSTFLYAVIREVF